MRLIVLASEAQKQALLPSIQEGADVVWLHDLDRLSEYKDGDVLMDLLFTQNTQHIEAWKATGKIIIVHSVAGTLQDLNIQATRINAWPGFLEAEWIEAATNDERREVVEQAFVLLGKKVQWLPDEPGFVSARVISMIISEAYLTLEEGVSTKEEINTAMKLGTNYPLGPFEWAAKIGLAEVVALLKKRGEDSPRYQPAKAMLKEIK